MNADTESVLPAATEPRPRSKPMLPVRGVCSLIDRDEDAVLRLIRDGSIAWAFNLALTPRPGHNLYLRILPAAVADYMHGRPCELKWPDVLNLLLPEGRTVATSLHIYRVLNVSGDHLYNLVRRKQIIPCSTWGRGPLGKGRFAVARFVQFLRARRFPND